MESKGLPGLSLLNTSDRDYEKTFNHIFELYFKKLYNFTLSKTGNALLAEELVMDLMVSLWNKRESLRIEKDLSSYLFGAMKNIIYSHFRKKELATCPLEFELSEPVASDTANSKFDVSEIQDEYNLSLAMLTPQRRKVFKLSREEDMSQSEIARHLNLSVKTVESHITASLRFMRERFKDYADLIVLVLICRFFL